MFRNSLLLVGFVFALFVSNTAQAQMGVGTTDPKAKLHVVSSGNTSASSAFLVEDSDFAPLLIIKDDASVGIGVTTPMAQLHIAGGIRANGLAGSGKRYLMADSLGNIVVSMSSGIGGGSGWSLTGDTGTAFGTNFLGTIDNEAFDIRVNNTSALRIYPTGASTAPNLVGGHPDNWVKNNVIGATIAGGGEKVQKGEGANHITDHYGVIGGGSNNQAGNHDSDVADAYYATIGGGQSNTAYRRWSTVGGGHENRATGSYSFVGGGEENIASYPYAVAVGGSADSARAPFASVVGGRRNSALADYAFVGGGKGNRVLDKYGTVIGGLENQVFGAYSTVLGGANNRIRNKKTYSMAFGCGADVNTGCAIVFNHPDVGPNATVFGVRVNNPKHAIHSLTTSTRDEKAAVYGNTQSVTAKQVMGIWGDASNKNSANTGTIGVLATGNGNKLADKTNTALQVNDGAINVGRTTSAPNDGASIVETATSGNAYSAEGPSGVVEIPYMESSDTTFFAGSVNWATRLKINNQYVKENSIILVQVLNHTDGKLSQGTFKLDSAPLSFRTSVDDREDGSFILTIGCHNNDDKSLIHIDGGNTDDEKDVIRVGYLVINPSK